MAEAFLEKLERNFLGCAICFEQLKDPVGLPCLHGFCFECLQNWHQASQNKGQVICPACKKSTPLPENGVRGFPGHFIAKYLKETLDKEKERSARSGTSIYIGDRVMVKPCTTEQTGNDDAKDCIGVVTSLDGDEISVDFPEQSIWQGKISDVELVPPDDIDMVRCDLCDKPADTHCLDCKQYLCTQCHKQHNGFKPMKGHEVVAASDVLSGKISSKGRHCELHDERIRYYCTTENKQVCHDCVNLKTCPVEHDRVTLAKAARMQVVSLHQLVTQCDETTDQYMEAVSETAKIMNSLNSKHEEATHTFEKLKEETERKLQDMWTSKKLDLSLTYWFMEYSIRMGKSKLVSKLKQIQEMCDTATTLADHGSDHEITFNFTQMSKELKEIIKSPKPEVTSQSSRRLDFDIGKLEDYLNVKLPIPPPQPPPPSKSESSWRLMDVIRTTSIPIKSIDHIVAFPDGKIAVSGWGDGVGFISSEASNTLQASEVHNAPKWTRGIAITPDDRLLVCGKTKLLCFNTDSKLLNTIATSSANRKSSPPVAVAVDNKGRIIVGVEDSSISIHYADGTLLSQFGTLFPPHFISVTSGHLLVVTFRFQSKTLKLLDYSGKTCTNIAPPSLITDEWCPGRTCCTPNNEILVINDGDGSKRRRIFRYDIKGTYLGPVPIILIDPKCMAFSQDGEKLYTTGHGNCIKIFHNK